MKRLVVALGGNALQRNGGSATAAEQRKAIKVMAYYVAELIERGCEVIITHGNGPQVGRIVLQNEEASHITPVMPLDVCGAMSQGMIGYHIQQGMGDELRRRGVMRPVATLITQVVVNGDDPAFKNPAKPIGPFYTFEEAKVWERERGYTLKEDAGRGWRRVVPSPEPVEIVELSIIKLLIESKAIVIAAGGGGVPVIRRADGTLQGIAAVIDKDYASERLAEDIDADGLIMLTAVEKASINFGGLGQRDLDKLTPEEARRYIKEGHFAPGSMLPKIKAAVAFAESKKGRTAIISSLEKVMDALKGKNGTIITQGHITQGDGAIVLLK